MYFITKLPLITQGHSRLVVFTNQLMKMVRPALLKIDFLVSAVVVKRIMEKNN